MKKIFMYISSILIIITALCFSAYSSDSVIIKSGYYSENADVFWSVYNDGSLVIEGKGKIQSFADSSKLPYIEFFKNGTVKSLIIKDGITEIGDYAFYGCSAETVEIASTVKKIGRCSFFGMKNVESINLSQSVSTIGNSAFSCSDKLIVSIDIGNKNFTVDEYGIVYDKNITEIIFCPIDGELSGYAFPSTLENIRDNAFNGVKNLSEVIFPRSLKSIGINAFKNCANLDIAVLNYGLKTIGEAAFEGCDNLNEIYYFSTEKSLSEVSMSDCGIDKSEIVCGYCKHRNTVSVDGSPALCNSPGYSESTFCNDCGVFTVQKQIIIENHIDSDNNSVCDKCSEEYGEVAYKGFCCEEVCGIIWVLYSNGNLAFYGSGETEDYAQCESPFYKYRDEIKKVTVGSRITRIGDNTFYGLSCLETVSGGEGVVSVGEGAFENALTLSEINGLMNLETVNSRAFKNCALSDLNFCSKVKNIGSESFYGCDFESIKLPGTVETLGDRAFYLCSSLKNIFLGQKVRSIGEEAFGGCDVLSQINVDSFNTYFNVIDGVLFDEDSEKLIKYPPAVTLDAYWVPDGTKIISKGAFRNAKNLEIIVFNDGLLTIGDYAFSECSSITDIEILYSVSEIGKGAFSNCINLKDIVLPMGIEKISEGTFYGCDGLERVTLCKNVKVIEESAFALCENLQIVLFDCDENSVIEIEFDETGNKYFSAVPKHFSSHTVITSPEILPICVKEGYTEGEYCKECKFYLSGHEKIAPEYYEHSIGNYSLFRDSTCTAEGEERAYCTRGCGYYDKRKIKLKKHKYSSVVTLSTCTKEGYTRFTCSCGYTYIGDITEKAEHNLSSYRIVSAPSCTKEGKERADCTDCSYYTERSVSAKGHSYRVSAVVKPTCTKGGYSVYVCNRDKCGASKKSDETDKRGHSYKSKYTVDKKATCKESGSKSRHCERCSKKTDVTEIKKLSHKYSYVIKSATLKKDGSKNKVCSLCGRVSSTKKINKIKSVKLSDTTYVYDRKTQEPLVTVKNSKDKTLKEGTDYTVKYQSGRKKTGEHTVKVTFKGNYSGTKTLKFKIIPQNVKNVSSKPSLKSIKLYWNEVKGATGYRIYYYNSKTKKYIALKDTKKLSYTVSKIEGKSLKNGNDYKFAVRAYSDNSGEKVFSSKMKKYTSSTKPVKVKIKKAVASSGKITVNWKKVDCDGYELVYATNKSFSGRKTVKIKKAYDTDCAIKGAVKGKSYYIKIRAYKIIDGEKAYGYYSDVKTVKVK